MLPVKPVPAVRERTEDYERASLSTWATLASETKGRDRFEEPDPLRTAFQVDRDRILDSEAFQRLEAKTYLVIAPPGAAGGRRVRVQLRHTLDVARIARTVARALRLNEDLAEAIALGHDLGYTPFGPAGEEALSGLSDEPFRHSEQGLRVVERLEGGAQGLNLSWEVRDGILHHSAALPSPATLEGQVVRLCDICAAALHDLGAALDAGVITLGDLPALVAEVLGATHEQRVTTLVHDAVATSLDTPEIALSPPVREAHAALERFLGERLHGTVPARAERDRAVHCLSSLALFYLENEGQLPEAYRGGEPLAVRVADRLAAMTDGEALREFTRVFLPHPPD